MKMAKASEADLKVAMELTSSLESLMRYGHMPCDGEHDDPADFDIDSPQDCQRALHALFDIVERGSLMRVVWGMAVLLDPANEIVDPDSDVLEHHPKYSAAPELLTALNEIVSQIDQGGSDGKVFARDYCITRARAAIAKATGGAA